MPASEWFKDLHGRGIFSLQKQFLICRLWKGKCPFHRTRISDIYITIHNSKTSYVVAMKILWLGGHKMGNCIKALITLSCITALGRLRTTEMVGERFMLS